MRCDGAADLASRSFALGGVYPSSRARSQESLGCSKNKAEMIKVGWLFAEHVEGTDHLPAAIARAKRASDSVTQQISVLLNPLPPSNTSPRW
jgi:hypothetical protein